MLRLKPRRIEKLSTYIGIEPFDVLVDESEELNELVEKAQRCRNLPFSEKLKSIKQLCIDAMENAYEGMFTCLDVERKRLMESIVMEKHPLSFALKHKAGCCRYQGVLFFILGFEAELGDVHLLQSAYVTGNLHTVFNDVYKDGKLYRVNVFTESLKDKKFDYSMINPGVYNNLDIFWPDLWFYSYRRIGERMVILKTLDTHLWPPYASGLKIAGMTILTDGKLKLILKLKWNAF